jgi:hypothetical protein
MVSIRERMFPAAEELGMKVELTIAGISCAALAVGHWLVGRWVLPSLTREQMPSTRFGSRSMTLGMVRFTWHVVTLMNVAFATLLITLAWAADVDPETLLLRWFAAFWLAATATAFWNARRRPSSLLRLPVPAFFLVIAVMCWIAST